MTDQREVTHGAAGNLTTPRPRADDSRIVPLDSVSPAELGDVLEHERACWARELDWDFSHTSGAIERSLESGGVAGFGLRRAGRVVAYAYYVAAATRSHIGSVHALPGAEPEGAATLLLERCLFHLTRELRTRRLESQFLYFGGEDVDRAFAGYGCRRYDRQFLRGHLDSVRHRLAPPARPDGLAIERFQFSDLGAVAHVVHAGFVRSADAEMSECYATGDGCQSFVEGVTLRDGCGRFDADGSFVARRAGTVVGVVLASSVSPQVGHIVQLSVRPAEQGRGTGRQLLAAACDSLAARRMSGISLSVTTANRRARDWYARLGLTSVKDFSAWVWRRPA